MIYIHLPLNGPFERGGVRHGRHYTTVGGPFFVYRKVNHYTQGKALVNLTGVVR